MPVAKEKRMLIVVVDRDNDLYEKAGIAGPVIGREANLNAAIKLALADPQDTDANALFQAIKLHDEMKKDTDAVIVTLSGSKKLGYDADRNISAQLDRVLTEYPSEDCMVVTDGADDEMIMPIIQSRLKVTSVKMVVMKQAKELEKTYVVLLEKLRDPYYARILIGLPALLLLMGAFASYMSWGWEPIAIVIAVYLIQRLLGIDERISQALQTFQFSVESSSFILYLLGIVLILVSIGMAYQSFMTSSSDPLGSPIKVFGTVLQSLLLMTPAGLLLMMGGKMLDLRKDKNKIGVIKVGFYMVAAVLLWTILAATGDWIVLTGPPYVSFQDLVILTIVSMIIGYAAINIMHRIRIDVISNMKLDNKEVIDMSGMHLGKIVGIEKKRNAIIVQGPFARRVLTVESIVDAGEKVIVRL